MIPLDHVGFAVADYQRSKTFYEQALAPLGLKLLMEFRERPPVSAGMEVGRRSSSRLTVSLRGEGFTSR